MRRRRFKQLLLVFAALLAVSAQGARYLALYSHECYQLNPLRVARSGSHGHHKVSGQADASDLPPCHRQMAARSASKHKDQARQEHKHDHSSCLICQTLEMNAGFTDGASIAPALPFGDRVVLAMVPAPNRGSVFRHTSGAPRAPPV